MRNRTSHDDRVTELTRQRLAALTAELGRGEPGPSAGIQASDSSTAATGRHARRPVPAPRRLADWGSGLTPAVLQGRAHLGSAQLGLLCLVVAVGLVVAAWLLVRASGLTGDQGEVVAPRPVVPTVVSPESTPGPEGVVPSPGPTAPGAPGGTTGGTAGAGAGAGTGAEQAGAGDQIVVDVVGKVRRPGIAVLPAGSRVVDAVRAAGGVRRGVPPTSVNMARLLTDGEQVVVGAGQAAAGSPAGEALGTPPAPTTGALVNLNTADQAALETLPGVGPVTGAAILQWRTEHGGFTSVDELLEVSGIGEATLAEIAPHVTL